MISDARRFSFGGYAGFAAANVVIQLLGLSVLVYWAIQIGSLKGIFLGGWWFAQIFAIAIFSFYGWKFLKLKWGEVPKAAAGLSALDVASLVKQVAPIAAEQVRKILDAPVVTDKESGDVVGVGEPFDDGVFNSGPIGDLSLRRSRVLNVPVDKDFFEKCDCSDANVPRMGFKSCQAPLDRVNVTTKIPYRVCCSRLRGHSGLHHAHGDEGICFGSWGENDE